MTASSDASEEIQLDWDNPIDGIVVASDPQGITSLENAIQEAQRDVEFQVVAPKGLSDPTEVIESPPGEVLEADRVVAFVYQTADYGEVVVQESLPEIPPEEWYKQERALEAMQTDPSIDTQGTSLKSVKIREGEEAFLSTGADGVSVIVWLENDETQFAVRGPELNSDAAVQVAEAI